MTDREKAIVMAYAGVAMLTGDKLGEYYKYCSELLGHPAYTHEVFSNDISERAKNDFIKLCKEEDEYRWHDIRKDGLPHFKGWYLCTWDGGRFRADGDTKTNKMAVCFFNGTSFPYSNHYHTITHWMCLPEKPFGGEDDAEIH